MNKSFGTLPVTKTNLSGDEAQIIGSLPMTIVPLKRFLSLTHAGRINPPALPKKAIIRMQNSDHNNYEGPFAWKPDHVDHNVWGTSETHDRTFGPPVRVEKDWYGNVTKVEHRNWLGW